MNYIKYGQAAVLLTCGILLGIYLTPRLVNREQGTSQAEQAICAEHGVAESVCTRCHAELIASFQTAGDWCDEHGVPESQCTLCNPDLAALGVKPPDLDATLSHEGHDHDADEAHGGEPVLTLEAYPGLSILYRTNQPDCPTDEATIQFASVETAERAGIEVQPVMAAPESGHFEAPAEVMFDENATTVFASSLPVSIVSWQAQPGDRLHEGEALATVESPEMAILQAEYLEAWSDRQVQEKELARTGGMVSRGLVDSATYERAQGEASSARARCVQSESRLRLAGLSPEDLEALQLGGPLGSRFTLRSQQAGTLLERTAPLGRLLEPGAELARIGDPAAIWIEAHLRERDAARVRQGQRVEFAGDGSALSRVAGEIIWISSFLDPLSRTATVRVRPDRGSVILRAHEFGRLHLPESPAELSLSVPRDAVQWEGCCNVVFVQESGDRFRPRKVEIAAGDDGRYRVIKGLHQGEQVVVKGSFLLKTELKKGAIGAGCCGLEAS